MSLETDALVLMSEKFKQCKAEIKLLRERIRFVINILPNKNTEAIMVLMAALDDEKCCECSHLPDRGACDNFEKGMNGRCVYCDHDEKCHPGKGETFNLPLSVGIRNE